MIHMNQWLKQSDMEETYFILDTSSSTVAPASRKSDKREPSAQGYNWVTLFRGDINTGTWPYRLGGSQMRQ
jgi:hypothetical protein